MTQQPASPRARRRRPVLFAVLAGVLVLLIAGFFVLDSVARGYASGLIADKVRSSLSIPASTPVDVTVDGASVLLQLLGGRMERVQIGVDPLAFGALSGSATLVASGVPIRGSEAAESVRAKFTVGESELTKLFTGVPGLSADTVALNGNAVRLGTTLTLFGTSVPVGISFRPEAQGGKLTLTPVSFTLNGKELTAAALKQTLGSFADPMVATRTICVSALLPKSFVLDTAAVKDNSVVLAVRAKNVVLDHSLLSTMGSCPAS